MQFASMDWQSQQLVAGHSSGARVVAMWRCACTRGRGIGGTHRVSNDTIHDDAPTGGSKTDAGTTGTIPMTYFSRTNDRYSPITSLGARRALTA